MKALSAVIAVVGMAILRSGVVAADPSRPPNIILIVADDLGYGELGCYGGRQIPTPRIDSLAKNGARFTSGYVSCPVCSPTRAGLMTGRYQQRFGHEFNPGPGDRANVNFGLPLQEVTLPQRIKSLPYATGMFGKWHLGYRAEYQPQRRGFDEFFGFLAGAHDYFRPGVDQGNPMLRGTNIVRGRAYATEVFAQEAVSFIERHKSGPFFLYLPFNAVHAPLQAPEKYLARFLDIKDPKRRRFAAMLSALDEGVGRVLDKLHELKIEEQSLIFFLSDNGGPTSGTTSGNGPLRGFKSGVFEGGIRVPFVVQWPGRIAPGTVVDTPVIALDIHPTAVAAAGGTIASEWRLDGVNLLPLLTGESKAAAHERLYWRFGQQSAMREGDWKLVRIGRQAPQLFNLSRDLGESRNLARVEPQRLKAMQAAYAEWSTQLEAPRW